MYYPTPGINIAPTNAAFLTKEPAADFYISSLSRKSTEFKGLSSAVSTSLRCKIYLPLILLPFKFS